MDLLLSVLTLRGVVVMKKLFFDNFYFGRMWLSCED